MYVCEFVFMGVVGVCRRMSISVHAYAYCMYVFVYQPVFLVARCSDYRPVWWDPDTFVRSRPVAGDPDPIRIRARCGPDTEAIRRSIHGMIRQSVLVRAVKTRRRFGSETASFHVSVRYCVFTVVGMHYMLLLSFHVTFCYILPVWLLVPLHEISMIVHFNYIVDRSLYQHHFMCW